MSDLEDENTPKCTDVPWAPLALCVLIGFVVMSAIDMSDFSKTQCYKNAHESMVIELIQLHTLVVLIIAAASGLVFSLIYWIIVLCAPTAFIPVAMLIQLATSVTCTVYFFCSRRYMSGTFSVFWLLILCCAYFAMRHEIQEPTKALINVVRVAKKFPAIFMSSAFASLFTVGMALLTGMMVVANYAKSKGTDCSLREVQRPPAEFCACLLFCTFGSFMLVGIVRGVMRASICAVYGAWYYKPTFHGTPLLYGFGRSCSYSFGTITLGIFILSCSATVSLLLCCAAQASTSMFDPDASVVMSLWLTSQFIGIVNWILEAFCDYVFAQTALYNVSFVQGAKNTIALWRQQGWQAYRNELLASGLLIFVPLTVGSLSGLTCLVYLHYIRKEHIQGMAFLVSYAMIVGSNIAKMFVNPIAAGAQTLFIVSCKHPHVMIEKHSDGF